MITKEQAMTLDVFYHVDRRNADGTAMRVRRNGRTRVWKTRPDDFEVPVKYGLYEFGYIDKHNASLWLADDPTVKAN